MKQFFTCLALLVGSLAYSQPENIKIDSSKGLITDLLILNTCIPNQFSLFKQNDDIKNGRKIAARSLSVNVNHLTAFRIENINPLRYNYYINNELVTQFMTDVNSNSDNNSILKGTYLLERDIETVKIFTPSFLSSNQKLALTAQKAKLDIILPSIDSINYEIDVINSNLFALGATVNGYNNGWNLKPVSKKDKKKADSLNIKWKEKWPIITKFENKYSDLSKEYETLIANVTINSGIDFLNYNSDRYPIAYVDPKGDLKEIIDEISNFKDSLKVMKKNFSLISSLLTGEDEGNSINTRYKNENSLRLQFILSNYGYRYEISNNNEGGFNYASKLKRIEIMKFMLDKKYQVYESFLLKLSTDVGKLLQNKFIEYSQSLNSLYYRNCLPDSVNNMSIKENITDIFRFVQDLNADFSVLVSYFDLDSKGFSATVNNINTYYSGLLKFLKYLNYLEKYNRIEFSLPTFNNLKNIDLVRYKIDRDDRLTGSKQTYVYDLWIKGGVKIDFSAGVFLTSVTDFEYDKTRVYRTDSSSQPMSDTFRLKRKDKGNFDFAFGGMVNTYVRLGTSWVTPGISVGVTYSNSQKLQYLCALSLQLGKTERLIFHAGYAGGLSQRLDLSQLNYKEVLSDKKSLKELLVKGDINNFPIPYINKFVFKPFIGISYNLSKRNALNAVSGTGQSTYNNNLNPPTTTSSP